jgi:hypothetical protein
MPFPMHQWLLFLVAEAEMAMAVAAVVVAEVVVVVTVELMEKRIIKMMY